MFTFRSKDGIFDGRTYTIHEVRARVTNTSVSEGSLSIPTATGSYHRVASITHEDRPAPAVLQKPTTTFTLVGEQAVGVVTYAPVTGVELANVLEVLATNGRATRNDLLRATDFYVMRNIELGEATPAAVTVYRQALRDLPGQPSWPTQIDWPTLDV